MVTLFGTLLTLAASQGGGTDHKDAQRFDPKLYRIVLFDQRGSGDSTPASCLEDNTTQHLIEDIEKIRQHLQIGKTWHVFGGSWGSTLSLAYAQAHPEAVRSLTLRGIFTLRKAELDFFYQVRPCTQLRLVLIADELEHSGTGDKLLVPRVLGRVPCTHSGE